jgi:hypothetical protein
MASPTPGSCMTPYTTDADRTPTTLPCACGGFVTAKRAAPSFALLLHYRSAVHRLSAWGRATQINSMSTFLDPYALPQAQGEQPTAGRTPVDVSSVSPRASAAPPGEP